MCLIRLEHLSLYEGTTDRSGTLDELREMRCEGNEAIAIKVLERTYIIHLQSEAD